MQKKPKTKTKKNSMKLNGHDSVNAIQVRIPSYRKEILRNYCKQNHISMTRFIESCISMIEKKKFELY
jgi:hypothetical protein